MPHERQGKRLRFHGLLAQVRETPANSVAGGRGIAAKVRHVVCCRLEQSEWCRPSPRQAGRLRRAEKYSLCRRHRHRFRVRSRPARRGSFLRNNHRSWIRRSNSPLKDRVRLLCYRTGWRDVLLGRIANAVVVDGFEAEGADGPCGSRNGSPVVPERVSAVARNSVAAGATAPTRTPVLSSNVRSSASTLRPRCSRSISSAS